MKNKKIFIFILAGVIVVGLGIAVYLFLIPRCPASCDDGNSCTTEACSKETGYKCEIKNIPDCCGNKLCEIKEAYETCSIDCPNCDDINKCTKDSYDYHLEKCVNAPILDSVCCDNSACEVGESYGNCARDCPNCDDENKCTRDKYDYHKRSCVNEKIIPCCGNQICDKGTETHSNCSTDCPKCDDNNKLTADSFDYITQKCKYAVIYYYLDDFESGTQNWSFGGEEGGTWSAIKEGSNTVLKGTGHNWAGLMGKEWSNYIFKAKFKIIEGQIHFNYRLKQEGEQPNRYFIGLSGGWLNISKQIGENFFSDLARADNVNLGSGWHTMEIRGYGSTLNILVDGTLLIKYKDSQNPVLSGGMGLETLDDSEFLIDDIEIKVIAEKDAVYP